MGKVIDLTGQKFGRLTVIKRMPNNNRRNSMWLCRCDCGTEKVIIGSYLRIGQTKSCGCLQKELVGNRFRGVSPVTKLPLGVSSMRQTINHYKKNAKKRGLSFELTEKEFLEITQKECFYCGVKPGNITSRGSRNNGSFTYNGIDRVENNKGYTIDNIVPCCRTCNIAKRNLTLQEFKDWIGRVNNNMFVLKEVT